VSPPICTIDTSCVVALDFLDLLPQLSFLFSRVLLPRAVRAELFKRRVTKDRVRLLLRSYAFISRCNDYDKGTVDLFLIERVRQGVKDRGETEAVVQAAQIGATVIVDDPWGRELAERNRLDSHGTLWVLKRLFELDLLSGRALREGLIRLRRRGIRLPWSSANELLIETGQSPLTDSDR
jgi:predicted nucleic acid-binding protein